MAATEVGIRLSLEGAQQAEAQIVRVRGAIGNLGTAGQSAAAGSDRLAGALGRVAHYGVAGGGVVALAATLGTVSRALFDATNQAQRLQTQLQFGTGNAGQELDFLRGMTQRLGLQFQTTAEAYAGFAAASRGTALEGQKTRDVFESIAKASAVMGLSADQSQGALLAVQQMMSKGVVSAEEFRGQLGERLPMALQAGAKALGLTTAEFTKLMETGKIVSADFLPKFADAITEALGDAPEQAANRLEASANRMANAWQELQTRMASAGVSGAQNQAMSALANDVKFVADVFAESAARGDSAAMQWANAIGGIIGRSGFAGVELAAESLNGVLNTLSGGLLRLPTEIDLLPANLKPTQQAFDDLGRQIAVAQSELEALTGKLQKNPESIYFISERNQLAKYIQELRVAQDEKAKLLGKSLVTGSVPNPDRLLANANAGIEAAALAAAQAQGKAYADLMAKMATPQQKLTAAIFEAKAALGSLYTPEVEAAISAHFIKPTQDAAKKQAEATESAKAYANAMQKLNRSAVDAEATANGYTKTQKDLLEIFASPGFAGMDDQWKRVVVEQSAAIITSEQLTKDTANLAAQQNQAFDDYFERLEKERLATEARIKTGRTTLEQLQFETSLLTLNTTERELANAMRELERQGVVKGTEAWATYAEAIRSAIIDREAKKEAIGFWQSIEDTAKGVFTDVANVGSGAFERIGKVLKASVLDLLWQITGKQWLISIGAAAGVPGAAMAASTGASALSAAGTAASVINAGSTIGTMLGVAGQGISSFTTAVTAGVQSMVGITGTTAQMTASLQAAGYWTGSAASTAATTAGASAGTSVMAAAPYAAAAVAALYALGAFRTTKTVGSGLMGTLGEADGITSYELRRKSGTLFSGPDYSIRDNGVSAQNAALQDAFAAMKAGAVQVADAFGLSADTVADFTYRIGNELINPDTGGYGLKLEGLTEAQVQEKVSAALAQANDAIAAQILTVGDAMRTDLLPWMQRIADASGPTAATLQAIAEYPNKLLEVAGTSRDALVQTFAQGLMTGDAQAAGQSVANQLVASIEASLMGNASAQIFDIINRGIVTPMIDALITGQSVTEAVSQASIDAVVAKATAAAKTMGALFGSAEFQAAMDAIRSSVGSALGTAGAGLAYTPQYQLPATTVVTATTTASDLGTTVDDLAKKFASARDSLTETAQSLQVDLLRALGDESGARAAERAAYLAGFADLGQVEQDRLGVLYDQNQAIRDQITEIQKTKDAVEAARTGMVAYRAALVGTIALAAGEVDGVLAALEKSAAKDRKALEASRTASQSLVQDVTRVFDRLQSAVDSLFDSTASTQQWQGAQGQQYIRDALTAARATGAMPDAEDLARAIAAATSGLDSTQYGTQAEADYARLVLANELRDLQDISGDQLSEAQRMLTVAEDQLTALDDSLQAYRDQLDVMRGVKSYTGTTAELMVRLVAAMETERGVRATTAASALVGTGQAIYDLKAGNGVNAAGAAFNGAELAQAARDALAAGATGQSIYYAIQGSGFTLAQAEAILGATPGSFEDEARKMGLPSFDVGINRVPRDMTARIHKDEAVLPAPFNPWAGGTLPGFGGDQTALVAEIRALRTQNEQLEARLASMETNTRRTADSLERVTQNNALTVSAAPVF